jgi:hypothetical protein
MTEEFKAARNPDNPSAFVLPTGILQQDFEIIDEQEAHIVLTVRVPIDLIRDNRALLTALLRDGNRETKAAGRTGGRSRRGGVKNCALF